MNKDLATKLQSLFTKRYIVLERHFDNDNFFEIKPNDNFYAVNVSPIDEEIVKVANKVLKQLNQSRTLVAVEQVYYDKEIANFIENNLRTLEF